MSDSLKVQCPYCAARAGFSCLTKSRDRTSPHVARVLYAQQEAGRKKKVSYDDAHPGTEEFVAVEEEKNDGVAYTIFMVMVIAFLVFLGSVYYLVSQSL